MVPMVSGKTPFCGECIHGLSGEKAGRLERGVTVHLVSLLITKATKSNQCDNRDSLIRFILYGKRIIAKKNNRSKVNGMPLAWP